MMKVLLIIFIIFAFLAFLSIFPVEFNITFQKRLKLKIKYLFFSFSPISKAPQEVKEETVKVKDNYEEKKNTNLKDLIKKTGLSGFLKILNKISKLCKDMLKTIMKHTIIKDFNLEISVSDNDASKTALYYGCVCSTVYPSTSLIINSVKKCETYSVSISPDFQNNKSKVNFNACFKIKLLFLVSGSIVALFKFFKIILKIRKNSI